MVRGYRNVFDYKTQSDFCPLKDRIVSCIHTEALWDTFMLFQWDITLVNKNTNMYILISNRSLENLLVLLLIVFGASVIIGLTTKNFPQKLELLL